METKTTERKNITPHGGKPTFFFLDETSAPQWGAYYIVYRLYANAVAYHVAVTTANIAGL